MLLITGIYLAQFYHPHPTDAHESVVYIVASDLVRSIHFWTATVLLHLLRSSFPARANAHTKPTGMLAWAAWR
jgi:hypothetical protein